MKPTGTYPMSNNTGEQLCFHVVEGLTVRAEFTGGALSSDFGAVLLRETELHSGLIARLSRAIKDRRHPSYVSHSVHDLLAQRVFQVALGYEDANDSNTLRHDPMFKLAAGRSPLSEDAALAHASTFTRLGQSMCRADLYRLARAFVEHFIQSYATAPKLIVLDLDHTDSAVYGQQELGLFHAHYGEHCYLPLLIFEGLSGKLVTALLRPGKSPSGRENAAILRRVLRLLRAHWPDTHIVVRGDQHFAQPEMMRLVQADAQADFIFGLGAGNPRTLRPLASPWLEKASRTLALKRANAERVGASVPERLRLYAEVAYRAGTWSDIACRVILKAEVSALGENPRFIVTSIQSATPELLYQDLYCPRGQDENYIKQLKNDLCADRTSDHGFLANHLRLFYACAAYVLTHELRCNTLQGTALAQAQPATLRAKLFKLAVRVVQYKDRIKLHLPSACAVKPLLVRITQILYHTPLPKPG